MNVDETIKKINERLTEHILEHVKGKKLLVDISGGHDTRLNLSILLKHEIPFDAFTRQLSRGDVDIAKAICETHNINHTIIYKRNTTDDEDKLVEKYDVHLKGTGYSEYMCMLHKLNKSMNEIDTINEYRKTKKRNPKIYMPAFEEDVIELIHDIPLIYLMGGYIQKKIIHSNFIELMRYPFTYYDFRHLLMNSLHMRCVDFFKSTWNTGTKRNYHDD